MKAVLSLLPLQQQRNAAEQQLGGGGGGGEKHDPTCQQQEQQQEQQRIKEDELQNTRRREETTANRWRILQIHMLDHYFWLLLLLPQNKNMMLINKNKQDNNNNNMMFRRLISLLFSSTLTMTSSLIVLCCRSIVLLLLLLGRRSRTTWILFLFFLAISSSMKFVVLPVYGFDDETSYNRYITYPEYCSTPEQVNERSIPPLRDDVPVGETKLAHVTAIIRHGARTPLSHHNCWDGYWTGTSNHDPSSSSDGDEQQQQQQEASTQSKSEPIDTSYWNCKLHTYIATPPPFMIQEEENTVPDFTELGFFLFEKRYDALQQQQQSPEAGGGTAFTNNNVLNGTCQLGQLIQRGYNQAIKNGQILADAYLFGHDKHGDMKSTTLDLMAPIYESTDVYFRSDDDQRTQMTGQVLLQSMFGGPIAGNDPYVPYHLADRNRDILSSNEEICPRLTELKMDAYQSKEFRIYNNSQDVQLLRRFMAEQLTTADNNNGRDELDSPHSCLLTTICNDLTMPDSVNDYGGNGNNTSNSTSSKPTTTTTTTNNDQNDTTKMLVVDLDKEYGMNRFERLLQYDHYKSIYVHQYNDNAYSKLAMGPLWSEIQTNLENVVITNSYSSSINTQNDERQYPRFALFSGHDGTIISLLSSLNIKWWNNTNDNTEVWPTYAAMLIIEIHEIVGDVSVDRKTYKSNFVFRLLYNGHVLTSLIDGCSDEYDLCDYDVLRQLLHPIATNERDCNIKNKPSSSSSSTTSIGNIQIPVDPTIENELIHSPMGIFFIFITMTISSCIGSTITCWYMTKRNPFLVLADHHHHYYRRRRRRRRRRSNSQSQRRRLRELRPLDNNNTTTTSTTTVGIDTTARSSQSNNYNSSSSIQQQHYSDGYSNGSHYHHSASGGLT